MKPIVPDFWKIRGRYSKAGMLRALKEQNAFRVGLEDAAEGPEPAAQEETQEVED